MEQVQNIHMSENRRDLVLHPRFKGINDYLEKHFEQIQNLAVVKVEREQKNSSIFRLSEI